MPYPLSSQTAGHLIEAIDQGYTHSTMDTLFLKAGVDRWADGGGNKQAKATTLLSNMARAGTKQADDGAFELARLVLAHGRPDGYRKAATWYQALKDAVAADGWEFDETTDQFVPLVPGMSVADETNWIGAELDKRGWTVPAGHYRQAVSNFADGKWASANSQIRAFFESLVRTAAGNQSTKGLGQVQAAFDILDARGDLVEHEAKFGKATWNLLHEGGSHPGLSDQDHSRFRLLMITGYSRLLLSRLPA